jgi:hypothetical protein
MNSYLQMICGVPTNCYAFIDSVNKYGNPSNRYDYFGLLSGFSDLLKLDQVVFALRLRLTNERVFAKIQSVGRIENPRLVSYKRQERMK